MKPKYLGVDLIVHFGHAKLLVSKIPTLYIEARSTIAVKEVVEKALPLLGEYSKVGLATTVQHLDTLKQTRTMLLKAGKTVVIGECDQLSYPGQVIGCNYGNVKSIADQVEAFIFIGGGMFHALGVALSTSKPTIIADPYNNRAFSINDEAKKIIKQRWTCVQESHNAKTFGSSCWFKTRTRTLRTSISC